MFTGNANSIDISIFDNRPAYSRAAPSPPVRTKLSPSIRRTEINCDVRSLREQGKLLGATGILDDAPIPPRRKMSPKTLDVHNNHNVETCQDSSEDLIKF